MSSLDRSTFATIPRPSRSRGEKRPVEADRGPGKQAIEAPGKALLREVQTHPWKKMVYHLSFFAVQAQDAVEVGVTLHFVGEPVGVKDGGGVLNTEVNEVTVKCKAVDIPEVINVDVSGLGVGDAITVADLNLPEGAVVAGDQSQIIASVLQG